EDGIRDFHVTGVQTCALPISLEAPMGQVVAREGEVEINPAALSFAERELSDAGGLQSGESVPIASGDYSGIARVRELAYENLSRSEERRVGKECKCRRAPYQ